VCPMRTGMMPHRRTIPTMTRWHCEEKEEEEEEEEEEARGRLNAAFRRLLALSMPEHKRLAKVA